MSESVLPQLKSVKKSILAARFGYIAFGIAMSSWACFVPFAKERLQVDEGTLGLLLLFLGFGALVSLPISGALANRFGCRKLQDICMPIYYMALIMLVFVPYPFALAIFLFVFGAMSGTLDVTLNLQVVLLEQASGRRLMSTLHAMYSIGLAIGASITSFLLSMDFSPLMTACTLSALVLFSQFAYFSKYFHPFKGKKEKVATIAIPKGRLLTLGWMCFILYMIEGVVMDWSALFMTFNRFVSSSEAGLAYAIFALTTTFGRLIGDRIAEIIGSYRLLIYSCMLTCIALVLVYVLESQFGAYFSFFLLGLGGSNTITQVLSLASKQKDEDIATAMAGVSAVGFFGFLVGPAIMGFVAEGAGLPFVFLCMALFVGIVTVISIYISRH